MKKEKWSVRPVRARRGCFQITCDSQEKAESTRKTQEVLTGIAWEIVQDK